MRTKSSKENVLLTFLTIADSLFFTTENTEGHRVHLRSLLTHPKMNVW